MKFFLLMSLILTVAACGKRHASASDNKLEAVKSDAISNNISKHILELNSSDEEVRREAAFALAKIGKPAISALLEVVKNGQYDSKYWALVSFLNFKEGEAITALPEFIINLKSKNEKIRELSAEVIGQIGPQAKEAIPHLIEGLDDKFFNMVACREALTDIGPIAVPALKEAFLTIDDRFKGEITRAIGYMNPVVNLPEENRAFLLAVLSHEDMNSRYWAAYAFYREWSTPDSAVPALLNILKEENYKMREVAAQALGGMSNLGSPEVISALRVALNDESPEVVKAVKWALNRHQK